MINRDYREFQFTIIRGGDGIWHHVIDYPSHWQRIRGKPIIPRPPFSTVGAALAAAEKEIDRVIDHHPSADLQYPADTPE